jgi:phosphate transport system protein
MTIFDDELKELRTKVLKLGCMVENAIHDSVKALVERDTELAREVVKRDHLINAMDVGIDEECVRYHDDEGDNRP